MKTCCVCKQLLPFELFSKNKKAKDGLKWACKKCSYKREATNQKKYRDLHKEKKSDYNKTYHEKNKDTKKAYDKAYYQLNKGKISIRKTARTKKRKKEDPAFRLRILISSAINHALKFNQSSKNNVSCLEYLPYTVQDLKEHIEKQFKPWMNWSNHGKYNATTWNNKDKTTWTWNLDHKKPQSDLPYTSMTDDNFKICWSLDNLRPYSAKQNILDGVNRTRHANNKNGANRK